MFYDVRVRGFGTVRRSWSFVLGWLWIWDAGVRIWFRLAIVGFDAALHAQEEIPPVAAEGPCRLDAAETEVETIMAVQILRYLRN